MILCVLALLVAATAAAPIDDSGPVELIVHGVPEGHALELGDIVDIKLKEHADGEVIATDLLHPLTSAGIAEAAVIAAPEPVVPEVVIPEPVVLPAPVSPEVVPEPVVLPAPVSPEFAPEPVVLPAPVAPEVLLPQPVVLPEPIIPEVEIPEPVVLPSPVAPEVLQNVDHAHVEPEVVESVPVPAPQVGEIFNDGTVQVNVNVAEPGMMDTIHSWFNMMLNYISAGTVQTSQQII